MSLLRLYRAPAFGKFRDYPALTEKLRQIQAWRAEEELIYIRLKKRLVLAKKTCFVLIPLLLINGWMGCIFVFPPEKTAIRTVDSPCKNRSEIWRACSCAVRGSVCLSSLQVNAIE